MKYIGVFLFAGILSTAQAHAGGCSEMAAFKSKINNYLETAALSDTNRSDMSQLVSQCEKFHNQGMAINEIPECGAALKITQIN